MDKWLKRPLALDSDEGSEEPAEKRKKEAKLQPRQYSENNVLYGFTPTSADPPQPQCFWLKVCLFKGDLFKGAPVFCGKCYVRISSVVRVIYKKGRLIILILYLFICLYYLFIFMATYNLFL